MKNYLLIFPVALMVAYTQLIVKWRMNTANIGHAENSFILKLFCYLKDPYILSSTFVALLSGLIWIFVVARVQVSVAFPIYYGLTFALVILGSVLLLGESLSAARLTAIIFILTGVIIGVRN